MNPLAELYRDADEPDDRLQDERPAKRAMFSLPVLYESSVLGSRLNQESLLFSNGGVDTTAGSTQTLELPVLPKPATFQLPSLQKPPTESLFTIPDDLEPIWMVYPEEAQPAESLSTEIISDDDSDGGDLWLASEGVEPLEKSPYLTWDSFINPEANTPVNPYLTEAGTEVFDATLEFHQNDIYSPDEAGAVVHSDVFLICLLHLGLGRSSVLFTYNKANGGFVPVRERLRITGCSVGAVASIVKLFAQCGRNMKALERFSKRVYKEQSATPTRIAIAECTMTVISALQTRLSIPASSIRSLIHLESLFREPAIILASFARIILEVKGMKEDSKLLSKLFQVIQKLQYTGGSGWLRPILMEVMRRVSKPWLEFVEQWIGLSGGLGSGMGSVDAEKFFVGVEKDRAVDENGERSTESSYVLDMSKIPAFMTAEDSETVFECGKSLRFLHRFHPKHPLSRPGTSGVQAPRLDWKFSWEDLEGIHAKAKEYETALQLAIAQYREAKGKDSEKVQSYILSGSSDPVYLFDILGKDKLEISTFLSASISAMNAPLPPLDNPKDKNSLRHVILHSSRSTTTSNDSENDYLTMFAPPMGITPLLSFSQIFAVQARLVNAACLRMFFAEHKIREHLSLLFRFQLFGDGVFKSRLTHALFDEDLDTVERETGVVRSGGNMGLKLGSRDTWPPASSELRLALMGILTEAYHGGRSVKEKEKSIQNTSPESFLGREGDIPGSLSFSIREMSQEEFEQCVDPNSISALDFLKIYYKPPAPLDAVITRTALYRYDRLFRLLLRVIRMTYVVDRLWREGNARGGGGWRGTTLWRGGGGAEDTETIKHKFRIEAHHFVSSLAGYIFETGVKATWAAFEHKLDVIESGLRNDEGKADTAAESLSRLRAYHEKTLDRIMFSVLLRRRQEPVMKLIEDIFGLILKFARYCSSSPDNPAVAVLAEAELKPLHRHFRKQVKTFIDVCRMLSEKRGYGDTRAPAPVGHPSGQGGAATVAVEGLFGGEKGYREEGSLLGMLLVRLEMSGYYGDYGVGSRGGGKGKGSGGRGW